MYITIFVLIGIVGATWYLIADHRRIYSLTAEQTAELNRQIDRDAALAAALSEPTSSMVDRIDNMLALVHPQQDILSKADSLSPNTGSIDVLKPAKRKTYYYPKKK
jgi:hypothetical protein